MDYFHSLPPIQEIHNQIAELEMLATQLAKKQADHLLEFKQQHSGFPMDTQRATSVSAIRLNCISQSPSL